jgi:Rieske Fe-S protein
MNRRDLYRYGTVLLGNAVALALAVPGVAYVLDPLRKSSKGGDFQRLARLSELTVGEPRSYAVIEERQDAWVKYPREPVGSVWLVRQPEGSDPPVIAFTTECPHLGCAVNLRGTDRGKEFLCPCHTSAFDLKGRPLNSVPPRGMDALQVEVSKDADPEVRVKFQRFRTQEKEKTPLA